MTMHKLMVLYGQPKDPVAFKAYYEGPHAALAVKIPGVKKARYTYSPAAIGGASPFFCIFEAMFADVAAFGAAMQSPAGQAAAADIANFATGGVTILNYPVDALD
jgi:uncharacterized protein (TIGR02118 family)